MAVSHERPPADKRRGFGRKFWLLLDLLLGAGVALLTWPFHGLVLWYRELRFARRMRDQGRFIPWPQLEPRLIRGEGTLIVEQARYKCIRVWWAPGNVLETAPKPSPPREDELDYERRDQSHPFVAWCYERYLHPVSGQAVLTQPPYVYPRGIVKAGFFNYKGVASPVVMTVRLA